MVAGKVCSSEYIAVFLMFTLLPFKSYKPINSSSLSLQISVADGNHNEAQGAVVHTCKASTLGGEAWLVI